MKRKTFLIIVSIILILNILFLISNFIVNFYEKSVYMGEYKLTSNEKTISKYIFNEGCIRNEESAAKIAEIIFESVFGEFFDYELPLLVDFDKIDQNWLIMTRIPENHMGIRKYLIIRRSNAEIVAIWKTN